MIDKRKKSADNKGGFLRCNNTEEAQETSIAIANLFCILNNIKVSPELIAKNQWKSVDENGDLKFYY